MALQFALVSSNFYRLAVCHWLVRVHDFIGTGVVAPFSLEFGNHFRHLCGQVTPFPGIASKVVQLPFAVAIEQLIPNPNCTPGDSSIVVPVPGEFPAKLVNSIPAPTFRQVNRTQVSVSIKQLLDFPRIRGFQQSQLK
jgi:hypothetical protein